MKRLVFEASGEDNKKLVSKEYFCDTDYYRAIIDVVTPSQYTWSITDSVNGVISTGNTNSLRAAKKVVKSELKQLGAQFNTERRKYKF